MFPDHIKPDITVINHLILNTMKNKSSHSNLLNANRSYKSASFSVSNLQTFILNAIQGKLKKTLNTDLREAAKEAAEYCKANGLTESDVKFSIFLENYEKITGYKTTDKKGNNKMFSLFTYLRTVKAVKEAKEAKQPEIVKIVESKKPAAKKPAAKKPAAKKPAAKKPAPAETKAA